MVNKIVTSQMTNLHIIRYSQTPPTMNFKNEFPLNFYSMNLTTLGKGCLQELTSWGGLSGGASTLVCYKRRDRKTLGVEPNFQPFSLGLCIPPPRLETALQESNGAKFCDHFNSVKLISQFSPNLRCRIPGTPNYNRIYFSPIIAKDPSQI